MARLTILIPMRTYTLSFLMILLICACNTDSNNSSTSSKSSTKGALFTLLSSDQTGIDFNNVNKQNVHQNIFAYNYFFNGSGVASADFNNDGLPDLAFTANMDSDRIYLNRGNLKFEDITEESGMTGWRNGSKQSWSSGITVGDVNNDGLIDIYISKSGGYGKAANRANVLYINEGVKTVNGKEVVTFSEQSEAYGIHDTGHSTQSVFFDYDNDRDLDLYVMNHSTQYWTDIYEINEKIKDDNFVQKFSGHLYRNDGFKKFTDVTKEAGVLRYGFGLGLVVSDINDDGFSDIYVANDYSQPDFMYINNGDGTFTDKIADFTGHTSFYSMGADIADFNNDGLVDISVVDMAPGNNLRSKTLMPSMNPQLFNDLTDKFGYHTQYMFNALQLNQGNGRFSECAKMAGVHKSDWSWATLFADYDNDGYKDLFITNGYKRNAMDNDFSLEFKAMKANYPSGKVPNAIKEKWLNKPPAYKLKNQIYRNDGQLHFDKMGKKWGIDEESFSNGAVYVDLDLDGDLDLVVNNMDDEAFIYRNNSTGTNYLQINLLAAGRYLPSLCLNAKVTIHTKNGIQFQELSPVRGYQSAMDNILHFGLGDATTVDKVEVEWAGGLTQTLTNIPANQRLNIDKRDASDQPLASSEVNPLFNDISARSTNLYQHQENPYDDFIKELLLPHKNSMHGPYLSKADVNGDQLEDYYIGGAKGSAGAMYVQQKDGSFTAKSESTFQKDALHEDMESVFLDYDKDGDLDLFVVSGGNEYTKDAPQYRDRLYQNDGKGNFTKTNGVLPVLQSSGSVAVSADFDGNGYADLFVGGRMVPAEYPFPESSYILLNKNGKFEDATATYAPFLKDLGIITAASAEDINQDKKIDLVLAGEWMSVNILQNTGSAFENKTPDNIQAAQGWWSSIGSGDFDKDGDTDFILGNLGLNYKYKASEKEPFHIYCHDFDKTGNLDIVLGYFNEGICYPLRGRECSSQQMPFIAEKFPSFESFGKANLREVYGDDLDIAYHRTATNFATSLLKNNGNGAFELIALPPEAQLSSVNGILVEDFNKDGNLDALLAGNLFASEVETPRNDASVGLCLIGDGKGNFTPLSATKSGFMTYGDVKDIELVSQKGQKLILVANNNAKMQVFEWGENRLPN